MKFSVPLFSLMAAVLLSGCATGPYVVKEEDKLTDREKHHLFDYSRHFIIKTVVTRPKQEELVRKQDKRKNKKEVRRNDLSAAEREQLKQMVTSKDPTVRVRYTGPKEGKLSLSWVLPGKLQVIVSAEGKLDLSGSKEAQWRLNVIRYNRKCFKLPEELGIPAVD